jgi:hypothetical protein
VTRARDPDRLGVCTGGPWPPGDTGQLHRVLAPGAAHETSPQIGPQWPRGVPYVLVHGGRALRGTVRCARNPGCRAGHWHSLSREI